MDQFRRSILQDFAESSRALAAKVRKLELCDHNSDQTGSSGGPPATLPKRIAALEAAVREELRAARGTVPLVVAPPPPPDGSLVRREEFDHRLAHLDQCKVGVETLEGLLARKVDVHAFAERMAAKANNSELHQWAEDLSKEIHRRLLVKTDLRQFELLAKEVDKKVDQDKLQLLLGRTFVSTNDSLPNSAQQPPGLCHPSVPDDCSIQLSWSSQGSHDGLS